MNRVDPSVRDWADALELTSALRAGQRLPELAVAQAGLEPGEPAHAWLEVRVYQQSGIKLAFASSDPTTHAAAQRWAEMDTGSVVVTPARLVVLGRFGAVSFWASRVRRHWLEHDGSALEYDGATFKFVTERPVWFDVVVNAAMYRRVIDRALPEYVRRGLGE
ncbi:MAG TPA: hypothetical protein VHM65_07700 [Candidatus Lustribacter sp.]|nr:hypothetical protein [Candidatus Lustribacter sp.]